MKLNFIQQQEGGIEKMKGKTIVHLHIDTAYGREPLPAMRQIAKDWGCQADRDRDRASGPGAAVPVAADPQGEGRLGHVLGRRRRHERHGASPPRPASASRATKIIFVTFGGAEEDMIAGGDAGEGHLRRRDGACRASSCR